VTTLTPSTQQLHCNLHSQLSCGEHNTAVLSRAVLQWRALMMLGVQAAVAA
jgi:hypothetical protein